MTLLKLLLPCLLLHLVRAALVWNTNGEAGLFVSIAVPIDVHRRHVFLSYNFEVNYRLPRTWHKDPPILRHGNTTQENEHVPPGEQLHPKKRKKQHKKKHKIKNKPKPKPKPTPAAEEDYKDFFPDLPREQQETLLSRSRFYQILSHRFEQHGFGSGDSCLLRLICEVNMAQLGEHNGVLGSLMHVMFSPSSSRNEALPQSYYQAELDGVEQQKCVAYEKQCKRSVLQLITRPLADYIK